MARESCLIVRLRDDATIDEHQLVGLALRMREPPFDVIEDDGDYFVFVDAPRSVRRTEKAIMRALAASDVLDAVITPLVIGHKGADDGYSFRNWFDEPEAEPEPAVPAAEITLGVSLSPPDAFGWRALREELERQGRTVIGEGRASIEVGARDELDATALADDLRGRSLIRDEVTVTSLGWFRRWKIRQALLGNYAWFE